MREILFRGKDDFGDWWFGDYVAPCYTDYDTYIQGREMKDEGLHGVIYETVGQFTGLLDKNGTKIFDGDIVRVKVNQIQDILLYGDVVKEGIVRYDDEYPHFTLKGNFMNFVDWYYNGDIEVIGNIHDKGE